MDGWVDKWMDGWIGGWMNGHEEGAQTTECTSGYIMAAQEAV